MKEGKVKYNIVRDICMTVILICTVITFLLLNKYCAVGHNITTHILYALVMYCLLHVAYLIFVDKNLYTYFISCNSL